MTVVGDAFKPEMANSMLHRMRYLEERGSPYGCTQIKDLPIMGELKHPEPMSYNERPIAQV